MRLLHTPANTPEVVVITGASAGVGRAVTQAFARRGAHIGLLARGNDGLNGARDDVEGLGGKALVFPVDVSEWEQVDAAADAIEEAFGSIDIWINNAMVSVFSPFKEMTAEEFERVTAVTYLGVVYGTRAALKRMLIHDRGTIVQVGSALAYRGFPLQSAYCGAKHAIQGFSESVRCELLHDRSHVRLTMVQLPALNTPQFSWVKSRMPDKAQPAPPIYQPEVAAKAIYYAAHHNRRELYVGLSTVIAIVGDKVASGLGDRYLARTGYESQQVPGQTEQTGRLSNLWEPMDVSGVGAMGDQKAHGAFDRRAHGHSAQLWANTHRLLLVVLCLAVVTSTLILLNLWH
jgi:NAD(P)-dependent dehydrogenase (short-subunit alcohol dehydrogenase family)